MLFFFLSFCFSFPFILPSTFSYMRGCGYIDVCAGCPHALSIHYSHLDVPATILFMVWQYTYIYIFIRMCVFMFTPDCVSRRPVARLLCTSLYTYTCTCEHLYSFEKMLMTGPEATNPVDYSKSSMTVISSPQHVNQAFRPHIKPNDHNPYGISSGRSSTGSTVRIYSISLVFISSFTLSIQISN